jgi:hypothetical protein
LAIAFVHHVPLASFHLIATLDLGVVDRGVWLFNTR